MVRTCHFVVFTTNTITTVGVVHIVRLESMNAGRRRTFIFHRWYFSATTTFVEFDFFRRMFLLRWSDTTTTIVKVVVLVVVFWAGFQG